MSTSTSTSESGNESDGGDWKEVNTLSLTDDQKKEMGALSDSDRKTTVWLLRYLGDQMHKANGYPKGSPLGYGASPDTPTWLVMLLQRGMCKFGSVGRHCKGDPCKFNDECLLCYVVGAPYLPEVSDDMEMSHPKNHTPLTRASIEVSKFKDIGSVPEHFICPVTKLLAAGTGNPFDNYDIMKRAWSFIHADKREEMIGGGLFDAENIPHCCNLDAYLKQKKTDRAARASLLQNEDDGAGSPADAGAAAAAAVVIWPSDQAKPKPKPKANNKPKPKAKAKAKAASAPQHHNVDGGTAQPAAAEMAARVTAEATANYALDGPFAAARSAFATQAAFDGATSPKSTDDRLTDLRGEMISLRAEMKRQGTMPPPWFLQAMFLVD